MWMTDHVTLRENQSSLAKVKKKTRLFCCRYLERHDRLTGIKTTWLKM